MNLLTETLLTQHLALRAASCALQSILFSKTPALGAAEPLPRRRQCPARLPRGVCPPVICLPGGQEHPPLPRFGYRVVADGQGRTAGTRDGVCILMGVSQEERMAAPAPLLPPAAPALREARTPWPL